MLRNMKPRAKTGCMNRYSLALWMRRLIVCSSICVWFKVGEGFGDQGRCSVLVLTRSGKGRDAWIGANFILTRA